MVQTHPQDVAESFVSDDTESDVVGCRPVMCCLFGKGHLGGGSCTWVSGTDKHP